MEVTTDDVRNLHEVVDSQVALGHPMTLVPTDVLERALETLDGRSAISVEPTPDYLRFSEQDWLEARRKTKVWTVYSARRSDALGQVEWHGPWRMYVFRPYDRTLWSPGCLAALAQWCAERTREHKTKGR